MPTTSTEGAALKPRPGHHLCPKHGVEYGALEQCGPCQAGDPATVARESKRTAPKPPAGCRSVEQHERWFTTLADKALADVTRLGRSKKKDWHTEVAIKGHRDTAIKAARAAAELATAREEEALYRERLGADDDAEASH